ncbi:MAG: L,D-transpeptidase [Paenibacillus sp.]|nr:L,D-transpeptidase [Paenibacillus sp.]
MSRRNPVIAQTEGIALPTKRIIVDLSDFQLHLLEDNRVIRSYPVGIGKMLTATPTGEYTVVNKEPNPGGPFGAFWIGLSKKHYGIHGTNDPSSIGKQVSHGCIRMHNRDVLDLERQVRIGTPVTIRQ